MIPDHLRLPADGAGYYLRVGDEYFVGGTYLAPDWTEDPSKAKRFPTQDEAEAMAAYLTLDSYAVGCVTSSGG